MRKFFHHHKLLKKIMVTLSFIFIFILGRYIPIPTVSLLVSNDLLSLEADQISNYSIFGLGLGPWMYAMILSRVFTGTRSQATESEKTRTRRRNILLIVVASIQALGTLVNLGLQQDVVNIPLFLIESTLFLLAGAFVLSWFSNMNSEYGIGGSLSIVMVSLLLAQLDLIPNFLEVLKSGEFVISSLLILWSLLSIYVMTLLDKAEYRIKLKRISINNSMADDSYIPLRVNSAGGMPMMYSYILLTFPQYIIMLLTFIFPNLNLDGWSDFFKTTSWQGVLLYAVIIYILTIAFAFFNVDTYQTTESLRNSGDYFPNIRPGRPTQAYLTKRVWQLSLVSGLIIMICVSLPLLLGLGNATLLSIAPTTGILMMVSGMMVMIRQEIKMYHLQNGYKGIFE